MLEREKRVISSGTPWVEGSFLLIFVVAVVGLGASRDGRGDISAGAADIRVWEVHV